MGAVRLTHNGELAMKDMERVQRAVRLAENIVSRWAITTIRAAEVASLVISDLGYIDYDPDNHEFYFEAYSRFQAAGAHNTDCGLD